MSGRIFGPRQPIVSGGRLFSPLRVSAVAAGRWWDPDDIVEGSPDVLPEANGNTAWNLNVDVDATYESNNGHQQMVLAAGDTAQTGGPVAAGWTGPTYLGMWLRRLAAGAATSNFYLNHGNAFSAGAGRVNLFEANASLDQVRMSDGTTLLDNRYTPPADIDWHFREWLFPGGSLTSFMDGVERTPILDGITHPALNDVSAGFNLLGNVTGWAFGPVYYGNGLPTAAERAALRAYHAPV